MFGRDIFVGRELKTVSEDLLLVELFLMIDSEPLFLSEYTEKDFGGLSPALCDAAALFIFVL